MTDGWCQGSLGLPEKLDWKKQKSSRPQAGDKKTGLTHLSREYSGPEMVRALTEVT